MFAVNGAMVGIWASRIPAVAARHGLDKDALGLALLCIGIGAILAFPLAGRAADRHGAYRTTAVLAAAGLAALIGIALAPSIALLVVALFAFGATVGGMDVTMNTWATEVERHAARPLMSSFHAMWSLGAGLGGATGYLAGLAGLGVGAHVALGAAALALSALALSRVAWSPPRAAEDAPAPVFALPGGALLPVGIVAFCAFVGEGAVTDWSAIYMVESVQASEATAALAFAVFSAAMVAMRLLGDRAVAAFGPVRTAQVSGATAALGMGAVVMEGGTATSLAGFGLMGLGYAILVPVALSRAANEPGMPAGAAIARVATFGYGGMLLGPPVIGFVAEATSLRLAFSLLAALALVATMLARSVAMPQGVPR